MQGFEVTQEQKQKLLHRRNVSGRLSFVDKVPSRIEVRKVVANKLGVKEDLVLITQIAPAFGSGIAVVAATVYDDAEAMKRLVDTYMFTRHLPKEEKTKIKDELKAKRQAAKAAKQAAKKAGKKA